MREVVDSPVIPLPTHLRLCLLGIALFCGCAHELPESRVTVPAASINGRPAQFILDTGAETTLVFTSSNDKLGLKLSSPIPDSPVPKGSVAMGLSESAHVMVGKQDFTAQIPLYAPPWLIGLAIDRDGLIGWPEVRNNILIFDFAQQTVRAADQLPPETSDWLKFKIHPSNLLALEVPLRTGETGCVIVDTGSPFGVTLSPPRWTQWNELHPDAPASSVDFFMPGMGLTAAEEAWADRVTIGELELTDLPVMRGTFVGMSGTDHCVAMFGMYVLSRMDLIVDGKNGNAYVHLKRDAGPYYPGFNRPGVAKDGSKRRDWTLADNVQLTDDHLRVNAAMIVADRKVAARDYAGAIADYAAICNQDPHNFEAFVGRGIAQQCNGDFAAALSDYDHAVQLQPLDDPENEGPYLRLYRQALLIQMGKPEPEFASGMRGWRYQWPKTLGRFLAGQIDESALLSATNDAGMQSSAGQKCEAYYFIGVLRMHKGDLSGARDVWKKCIATGLKDYTEYRLACANLDRPNPAPKPGF